MRRGTVTWAKGRDTQRVEAAFAAQRPIEDTHYIIFGAHDKEPTACMWVKQGDADALLEEPPAGTVFREQDPATCPICTQE